MTRRVWDAIIVGRGLAGTTLAWHLRDAGKRVLLVDAQENVTSSKIAAGLITPITGKRLNVSWRFDDFYPSARDFYRSIEARTEQQFFYERTAVRVFYTDTERHKWAHKRGDESYSSRLLHPQPKPLIDVDGIEHSGGGFAMKAAQLDVAAYLECSRRALDCLQMSVDWYNGVDFEEDVVRVGDHLGRLVISCEGFAASRNPYFSFVPFRAAKGEILTVRFARPLPPHILHRKIWIAPTTDPHTFRVGATYKWDELDCDPTRAGRDEIEEALRAFTNIPFTVTAHQAAVRPIIHTSRPVVGMHPENVRLGYFNGLGSKGSLLAPKSAAVFTDYLANNSPLPEEVDLNKRFAS